MPTSNLQKLMFYSSLDIHLKWKSTVSNWDFDFFSVSQPSGRWGFWPLGRETSDPCRVFYFLKSRDRLQLWRRRTSNRNYWWYQLTMSPSGKDLTEHGRRYNDSEFWRLPLKYCKSIVWALYETWKPLKIIFIILKISAILGVYRWIACYCSCDGIEPCASIRSSALLKNCFLNFLH